MMEALDRRVHARLDEMDADEMDARVRESDASTWTPEAWYRWLRAAARREGLELGSTRDGLDAFLREMPAARQLWMAAGGALSDSRRHCGSLRMCRHLLAADPSLATSYWAARARGERPLADWERTTPLHAAAHRQLVDVVRLLVEEAGVPADGPATAEGMNPPLWCARARAWLSLAHSSARARELRARPPSRALLPVLPRFAVLGYDGDDRCVRYLAERADVDRFLDMGPQQHRGFANSTPLRLAIKCARLDGRRASLDAARRLLRAGATLSPAEDFAFLDDYGERRYAPPRRRPRQRGTLAVGDEAEPRLPHSVPPFLSLARYLHAQHAELAAWARAPLAAHRAFVSGALFGMHPLGGAGPLAALQHEPGLRELVARFCGVPRGADLRNWRVIDAWLTAAADELRDKSRAPERTFPDEPWLHSAGESSSSDTDDG